MKPRLRDHIQVHRHHYRDERWYILQDDATGSYYRFSPGVYFLIGLMNGKRSVNEIWEQAIEQLGDNAPSQDQTLQLLGQLHAADALQGDISPDSLEVFQRHQDKERRQWKQRLLSPLSLRIPLCDPERFLRRWQHLVRPLFTRTALVVWLLIVISALAVAGQHWDAITGNLVDRVLAPQNLVLLWLTYPLVKLLHELGHAFATRVWGGEVHEMGIMFLVLMPIPYVDASAATAFDDKRKRMAVASAGMIVELLLAALALFVWINVESGIVSAVAYNIMLIGSLSTLLFNGNPLLRFDGYYVLADAIETPNLGNRANRHIGYLIQRYLFGVEGIESPATARGEATWFVFYGLAAFAYRMSIMFAILLYVAGKFFVVGIALAIWAAVMQIVLPLAKHTIYLFRNPRLRRQRLRAVSTSLALLAFATWLVFFMDIPLATRTEGVVWLPEQSRLRTGSDCFITRMLVEPGARVAKGDVVMSCEDPMLSARVDLLRARLRELQARYYAERVKDYVKAEGLREEVKTAESELAQAQEELEQLEIRSQADGWLVVPGAIDLPGQFRKKGSVVAYVMNGTPPGVRVVVSQNDIALVRQHTEEVEVRLAGQIGDIIAATIEREVPAATNALPSSALGTRGGGRIAVDPMDEEGLKAIDNIFQFELKLADATSIDRFGQRVHVRFDHGSEPLAAQWGRSLHQLLMREFGV
jgi:putative peptide zinc metalloprotease protein